MNLEKIKMRNHGRRYILGYGVAALVVLLAVFLVWLLDPILHERVPHATVYDAVAIVFWVGGLGIGFTIVRRLVELHGGSIAAESDGAGKGAAFTVRLLQVPVAIGCMGASGRAFQR